jgi:hypothetical protein
MRGRMLAVTLAISSVNNRAVVFHPQTRRIIHVYA